MRTWLVKIAITVSCGNICIFSCVYRLALYVTYSMNVTVTLESKLSVVSICRRNSSKSLMILIRLHVQQLKCLKYLSLC